MADPTIISVRDDQTKVEYHDGITFIARRVPNAPKFSIAALVKTGALDDEISGTAHFFEHVPFRGTKNFPNNLEVLQFMEARMGNVGAFTSSENTVYYGNVVKGFELDAISAISDLVCRPALKDPDILTEKETIIDEIADSSMKDANDFTARAVGSAFGPAAARAVIGTEETVERISPDVIRSFYQKNYSAERLIVAMEGDKDPAAMIAAAKEKFVLPRGEAEPVRHPFAFTPQTKMFPTDQAATKVTMIMPSWGAEKAADHLSALSNLLKDHLFGMNGPLLQSMRAQTPLIYAISQNVTDDFTLQGHGKTLGYEGIIFSASTRKVPTAVNTMVDALVKFADTPDENYFNITKKSRLDTQENHVKRNPEIGAVSMVMNAQYRGVASHPQEYIDTLRKLTLDQVWNFHREQFTGPAVSMMYVGKMAPEFPNHQQIAERFAQLKDPVRTSKMDARLNLQSAPGPTATKS